MKRSIFLFILMSSIVEVGCATMLIGNKQFVEVRSDPPGATVTVENEKGITPATFSLKRKNDYIVVIEKEGYITEHSRLERSFNGGMLLNLLIVFPPGMIVDAASGAAWTLKPNNIDVKLQQR